MEDTIYIKNKVGRVVLVEKKHGEKLIAKKEATQFFKPNKTKLYKMSKSDIVEKLEVAGIKHDATDSKEDLFNLIPKPE